MSISLCMIVKDEEKYLRRCLDSVKDLVDNIYIVDTGSTDNTKSIAGEYTDNIYSASWEDDFGKARNLSIQYAKDDWILIIDADETLDDGGKETIRHITDMNKGKCGLFAGKILSYDDAGNIVTEHYNCRLFSNNFDIRYKGRIHEQLYLKSGAHAPIIHVKEFIIHHYGYTKELYSSKDKINRNIQLLRDEIKDDKKNPFHHYNMMIILYVAERYNEVLKEFEYVKKLSKHHKYQEMMKPYMGHAYSLVANIYYLNGNHEKAFNILQDVLKLNPNMPDIFYLSGLTAYMLKRYDVALSYTNRAFHLGNKEKIVSDKSSGTWKALRLLGSIYYELEMFVEAIKYFSLAGEYIQNYTIYVGIAKCFKAIGDMKKCMIYYGKACELKDDNVKFFISDMINAILITSGKESAAEVLNSYKEILEDNIFQSINERINTYVCGI